MNEATQQARIDELERELELLKQQNMELRRRLAQHIDHRRSDLLPALLRPQAE